MVFICGAQRFFTPSKQCILVSFRMGGRHDFLYEMRKKMAGEKKRVKKRELQEESKFRL